MLRISQIKLPYQHTEKQLIDEIAKTLRISTNEVLNFYIKKKSIDARKKPHLFFVYTIEVKVKREKTILKQSKNKNICISHHKYFNPQITGTAQLMNRPIVVGSGPSGLFCAYLLALKGYSPILLERGAAVEERIHDVNNFWTNGKLNVESNVQFGEGGAGTFSDGKLNTSSKDPSGMIEWILKIFVEHGAPEEILYDHKPHIGTDILTNVVKNMREHMLEMGADIRFHSKVTDFVINKEQNKLEKIIVNDDYAIEAQIIVLAIGHSARDTFQHLYEKEIPMTAKSFAIGLRVEHPQSIINYAQYGMASLPSLSAAPYKLATQLENGRGVYSFCMCPGGYVVNASSEENMLAVNGMSYNNRASENANSAIVVTVSPNDFLSDHPLAGMHYQQKLEALAYQMGDGKIPIQRFIDFKNNEKSVHLGKVKPQVKGKYQLANLRPIFTDEISHSLVEGISNFESKIHGYSDDDTLLSGVESRTSSPIRIERDEHFESKIHGLFPCGEGAGYAGGITSAAMDGLKIAEEILSRYKAEFTKN